MAIHLPKSNNDFSLFDVKGTYRVLAWHLLLALTAGIFFYPSTFEYEYHPVQPLHIFHAPLLFAALYCLWLLVLFVLMLSRGQHLEKLVLVGLFALVFEGYWVVTSAGSYPRQDGVWNAGIVRAIVDTGRLEFTAEDLHPYIAFPGTHILTSFLSEVSGLNIVDSVTLVVLFLILTYAGVAYWLMSSILRTSCLSGLGAVLLLEGNLQAATELPQFAPRNMGIILMAAFVALLYTAGRRGSRGLTFKLAGALLLGGLAMTHLISALAVAAILSVMYLSRERLSELRVSASAPALALVMPAAWLVYPGTRTLEGVVSIARWSFEADPLSGMSFLWSTKLAAAVPLWVTSVQTFWLAALAVPVLLALSPLFYRGRLDHLDRTHLAGLLGVLTLIGAIAVAAPAGAEVARFLAYALFFTIPLALKFLVYQGRPWGSVLLACVVLVAFALSLPTFLADNRNENLHRLYASDEAGAQFLGSMYGDGKGHTVFAWENTGLEYDLYRAELNEEVEFLHMGSRSPNVDWLWEALEGLARRFDDAPPRSTFVYSRRLPTNFVGTWGVDPSDPNWGRFRIQLEQHNRYYDNGNVVHYIR
jgi:hypothetical protein